MSGLKDRHIAKMVVLLCILAMTFSGCGNQGGLKNSQSNSGMEVLAGTGTAASALSSGEAGVVTTLDVSDLFSNRDREIGYDESECERIALQGDLITISKEGRYILSGEMKGSVVVDADKKDKIQIILDGASITSENSAALYVKQADKVFVTTAAGSENVFRSEGEFTDVEDSKIDGAVFAKDDITFNGAGTLKVECGNGHGIVCKDDLVITSGTYEITAAKHGLQGKDSVRILSGDIVIEAVQDGIHSGNDDDETVGYTYIGGGNIEISAGDDGIHSDTQLVIGGGNLAVKKSYEGLEGRIVEITAGVIQVKASDDGVNAAGGNDGSGQRGRFGDDPFAVDESAEIIISGGVLTVNADGDGLDSNGALYVNGGVITIYGSTNGGNGALDYNGDSAITGGTLIALGASQMAENFGQSSTQASILVNVQSMQAAGTSVELRDASGRAILSCTAEKTYNSAVFSCSELQVGQTYTAVLGEQTVEAELTALIYGNGMGGGFGGPGGMGGFGGGRGPEGGFGDFDGGPMPEGGFGGFDKGQMPEGGFGDFDGGPMPEGGFGDFDGGPMPEGGFGGFDKGQMPEGGKGDFGGENRRPERGQENGRGGQSGRGDI